MKLEHVEGAEYYYIDPGELALLGRPPEEDGLLVSKGDTNKLIDEVATAHGRLDGEEAELAQLLDDDPQRLMDDARIARARRRLGQMSSLLAQHAEADVSDAALAAFLGNDSTQ